MNVLVTGAGGFVGLNIVEALLEAGHRPVGFVRETSNVTYLNALGVEIRRGDVTVRSSLPTALLGIDAVIHCAGNTSGFWADRTTQWNCNAVGTKNVVDAALHAGIKRLVYTSTTSTVGSHVDGRASDETVRINTFRKHSQYARSKGAAERYVLEAHRRGLEGLVLNPAEVVGEYDYHFGWGSVLLGLKAGTFPFVPTGAGSFCHAREVGRAHVAALTSGRPGERYILAGTDVTFDQFFRQAAALCGCGLPAANALNRNFAPVWLDFFVKEMLFPWTRTHAPLDLHRLRVFYRKYFFDSSKAQRDLGYRVRSLEEMLRDCHSWYVRVGLIA